MSYGYPPLRADGVGAIIVAATNTTLVAAPGSGNRLRLAGGVLSINKLTTGIVDLSFTDGVGGAILWRAIGLQLAGQANVPLVIPEPGIPLSQNTALVVQESATVAAGSWTAVAYYVNDGVS